MQDAQRRNKLRSTSSNISDTIAAELNLQDEIELLTNLHQSKKPLLHCSVFIEMRAKSAEKLHELKSEVSLELTRIKISADALTLRQKDGFLSVLSLIHI